MKELNDLNTASYEIESLLDDWKNHEEVRDLCKKHGYSLENLKAVLKFTNKKIDQLEVEERLSETKRRLQLVDKAGYKEGD
jgi:uncharacterized protein with HEPN domain